MGTEFSDAIKHMLDGFKVRSESWPVDHFIYISEEHDGLVALNRGGSMHTFVLRNADMVLDDWVIYEEGN